MNWSRMLPCLWLGALLAAPAARAQLPAEGLFSRTNLVAWCIVPFDSRKRGPEERAAMLESLGLRRLAYDWRAEHVPTFEAELEALKKHRIELTAWWMPAELNDVTRGIFALLERHRLSPQIWVTMGTEPEPDPQRLGEKIAAAVDTLAPLCAAAAKIGSQVALYNHLGWFGEPAHQVAIIHGLRAAGHTNVGIVYNFHHGHQHIDRFPELLWLMQPHLLAINLNGMVAGGDRDGRKIIPLGTGDRELAMLRVLERSGWKGPVGILGHTDEDAEVKLRKELEGLEHLVPLLAGPALASSHPSVPMPARSGASAPAVRVPDAPPAVPAAPPVAPPATSTRSAAVPTPPTAPPPVTPPATAPSRPPTTPPVTTARPSLLPPPGDAITAGRQGKAIDARVRGIVTAGTLELRQPPLVVEAWVRMGSAEAFNILVASEAKSSPTHWELYTYQGDGTLSFFAPGMTPSEVRSTAAICDGRWHHVAAWISPALVQLFVNGRPVAEQAVQFSHQATRGGAQLAIGRLVEGGLGCDGFIEAVRIGRQLPADGSFATGSLEPLADTLGIWTFNTAAEVERWGAMAAIVPAEGLSTAAAPARGSAPRTVNRSEPWKQTEGDWTDDRWNETVPARWQAYYFPTPTGTVRKGFAVRVGARGDEGTVILDSATGHWRGAWKGGFLRFDPARFGLIQPPRPAGELALALPPDARWDGGEFRWRGFGVRDERVVLEYSVGDRVVRESPWALETRGETLFTRDLEFSPSTTPLAVPVLTGPATGGFAEPDGPVTLQGFRGAEGLTAVAFESTPGIALERAGEALVLKVAARTEPIRLRLLYQSGASTNLASLASAVLMEGTAPDLATWILDARGPASAPLPVRGQLGGGAEAYVIDTIPVPYENPFRALLFCSGVGFFDNGDAAVSTIHGDVWRVQGLDADLRQVRWSRIATGLFQPLGLTVVSNRVVVLCRDHLTRLHDLNGDGFTDYYESLSGKIETSGGGHDYVTSLSRDDAGNFYFVDPLGVHRISPDGREYETLARGFRNPNGMGVSPDGKVITVAPQQGTWTPSSVIHEIRPGGWYGFPGPKVTPERPLGYDLPLCWIPHRIDNSSGAQVWAPKDGFGPLGGHLLHLSWGRCTVQLVLREVVDGVAQGAVMPLPGRYLSGPMRGAFHPIDRQLYVVGSQGWQTAAARDGSFQRLRWTGKPLDLPVTWHASTGALQIQFNEPLDRETAEDPDSYALDAWNYRYAEEYGSKDWSVADPAKEGHDSWEVTGASLSQDGRTVRLTVPALKPVMQFALKFNLDAQAGRPVAGELYGTIHRLAAQ